MSDLIRKSDALAKCYDNVSYAAIAALPAVTVGVKPLVWGYLGLTYRAFDPIDGQTVYAENKEDMDRIEAERQRRILAALEPVVAPDPAAIREAWEKAYWRMRSYAVHDNDCKLNKPPHFEGPCSCGLTVALEEALALLEKGAADDRA